MPRKVDPGKIKVGKGLAPSGTVEDNSLRYPERDVDPLRVHLHDPSRAHMASSIGIVDEADCFVSDEVEGALQEICANSGAGRLNGLISGGTFVELFDEPNYRSSIGPVATTSLKLTSPTEVMMGATVFDATGLIADLSGLGPNTYYIYLDTNSASPTFRTLLVSTTAPQVEDGGIEDVLFAEIVYDGANVTNWRDGRFFVRNLDRKITYSTRQGENEDAWSEGCFATLQAFFLWIQTYGAASAEEFKRTVIIRGTHEFYETLVLPDGNLSFVGDGRDAALVLAKTAASPQLIQSGAASVQNVTFTDIVFSENVGAGVIGVQFTDDCENWTFERCRFLGNFDRCVDFGTGTGTYIAKNLVFRDCDFNAASECVFVERGGGILVENCTFAPVSAGVDAITLGSPSVGVVSDARVEGCLFGASLEHAVIVEDGGHDVRVLNNTITAVNVAGVDLRGAKNVLVQGNTVSLSPTAPGFGVRIDKRSSHCSHIRVLANDFSPLASASQIYGVWADPGANAEALTISDNSFRGFTASADSYAVRVTYGILAQKGNLCVVSNNTFDASPVFVEGATAPVISDNAFRQDAGVLNIPYAALTVVGCKGAAVSGNSLSLDVQVAKGIEIQGSSNVAVTGNTILGSLDVALHVLSTDSAPVENVTIDGNTIDGLSSPAQPVLPRGVWVVRSATALGIENVAVTGNTISGCYNGIEVLGEDTQPINDVVVSGNVIADCAHDQDNPPASNPAVFASEGTFGIGLRRCQRAVVQGNQINNIGVIPSGTGFINPIFSTSILTFDCLMIHVKDNVVYVPTVGGLLASARGFTAVLATDGLTSADCTVSGNDILFAGGAHDEGIRLLSNTASSASSGVRFIGWRIHHNHIRTSQKGLTTVPAMAFYTAVSGATYDTMEISRNVIEGFFRGVDFQAKAGRGQQQFVNIAIEDNQITTENLGTGTAARAHGVGFDLQWNTTSGVDQGFVKAIFVRRNQIVTSGNGVNFTLAAVGTSPGAPYEVEVGGLFVEENIIRDHYLTTADPTAGVRVYLLTEGASMFYMNGATPIPNSAGGFEISRNEINLFATESQPLSFLVNGVRGLYHTSVNGNHMLGQGAVSGSRKLFTEFRDETTSGVAPIGLYDFSFSDNHIESRDTANEALMSWFVFQEWNIAGFDVCNNRTVSPDLPGGQKGASFRLDFGNSSTLTLTEGSIEAFTMTGNVLQGGIDLETLLQSITGLTISHNQIAMQPLSAAVSTGLAYSISTRHANTTTPFNDIDLVDYSIDDNTVSGGWAGILVQAGACSLDNVSVSRNTAKDARFNTVFGSASGRGIMLSLGDLISTPTGSEDYRVLGLSVCDNQITDCDRQGIFLTTNGFARVVGGQISRNTLSKNDSEGIWLDVGAYAGQSEFANIENLSVSDNTFVECGTGDFGYAFRVSATPFGGSSARIEGMSVSRNMFTNCGTPNIGGAAIAMDLADVPFVRGLAVEQNIIQCSTIVSSTDPFCGEGIDLIVDDTRNVTISGNDLDLEGYLLGGADSYGIRFETRGDITEGLTISNNRIRMRQNVEAGIRVEIAGDANTAVDGLFVRNNSIYYGFAPSSPQVTTDQTGIDVIDTGPSGFTASYTNMVIEGNVIDRPKLAGIRVRGGTDSDDREPGYINCRVDGNTIESFYIRGIELALGEGIRGRSVLGLSVCGNQILTSTYATLASVTGLDIYAGYSILTSGADSVHRGWDVSENTVYYTTTSDGQNATGIRVRASGQSATTGVFGRFSEWTINRNRVRNCQRDGIHVRLDSGNSVDAQLSPDAQGEARNISISDNEVSRFDAQAGTTANFGSLHFETFGVRTRGLRFHGNQAHLASNGNNAINYLFSNDWSLVTNVSSADRPSQWSVSGNTSLTEDSTQRSIRTNWFVGTSGNDGKPRAILCTGNLYINDSTVAQDQWAGGSNWDDGINDLNSNNLQD